MKQVAESHCQDCGRAAQGSYSECCNELVVGGWPGDKCEHYDNGGDCFHK